MNEFLSQVLSNINQFDRFVAAPLIDVNKQSERIEGIRQAFWKSFDKLVPLHSVYSEQEEVFLDGFKPVLMKMASEKRKILVNGDDLYNRAFNVFSHVINLCGYEIHYDVLSFLFSLRKRINTSDIYSDDVIGKYFSYCVYEGRDLDKSDDVFKSKYFQKALKEGEKYLDDLSILVLKDQIAELPEKIKEKYPDYLKK